MTEGCYKVILKKEKSAMLIPFHMNIMKYNLLWYQQASNPNAQSQQVNRHPLQKFATPETFP